MSNSTSTLDEIPAELLVSIVQQLDLIRSHEPQSIAFKQRDKEKQRLRENTQRTCALASLCLTSRKMRMIATPVLYASFASVATEPGLYTLQLYCQNNYLKPQGFDNHFSDFLLYVENRLSDDHGNTLSEMAEEYGEALVSEYFELLSSVVESANNIQHINIASIEATDVSFWAYIVPSEEGAAEPMSNFAKLQSLQLQAHADQFSGPSSFLFRNITTAVSTSNDLKSLCASGLSVIASQSPLPEMFNNIRRLEFTASMLTFDAVDQILLACNALRNFTCEWSYLACWDGCDTQPSHLHKALLKHASTLETLHLDMRCVRFYEDMLLGQLEKLGSLHGFTQLKSLTICEPSLFGSADASFHAMARSFKGRLSDLLPDTLECFTLLMFRDYEHRNQDHTSKAHDDDLIEDCKHYFKNLKVFHRYGCDGFDSGNTATCLALQDLGISYANFKENDVAKAIDLK